MADTTAMGLSVVECPKSMIGRVIGKGGETIKSLQHYTGAVIQIDQTTDPTKVTLAGTPESLEMAVPMVQDIARGTFKGFSMLRQISLVGHLGVPRPVYVHGYGFVPHPQGLQLPAPSDHTGQSALPDDTLVQHLLSQLLLIQQCSSDSPSLTAH